MEARQPIVAIYPGSFDPVTHGHLDVIRRGARLFNELIVGIGLNPSKEQLFSPLERQRLLAPHLRPLGNVRAETYDGLTIHFARQRGARVLLRGIRDVADLSDEIQQANLNRDLGGVETIFLMTSDEYALTSSTYVKQIFEFGGGDLDLVGRLVPPNVARALAGRLGAKAPPAPRPRSKTRARRK